MGVGEGDRSYKFGKRVKFRRKVFVEGFSCMVLSWFVFRYFYNKDKCCKSYYLESLNLKRCLCLRCLRIFGNRFGIFYNDNVFNSNWDVCLIFEDYLYIFRLLWGRGILGRMV